MGLLTLSLDLEIASAFSESVTLKIIVPFESLIFRDILCRKHSKCEESMLITVSFTIGVR